MTKAIRWVLVLLLLSASACTGDAEAPTAEGPEEASTTSVPSFQLEGRVVEASGSARTAQAQPTPSPAATATGSPTTTAQPEQTPEGTGTAIDQASPGSLALRLSAFSGQDTACSFAEGDTLVVAFTRTTTFEPADLTQNETFPNNLVGVDISIQGRLLDEANCVLVANSVASQQADQESPAASPTAGRATSGQRSPTPGRRPPATPTRRTQATPARTAAPTPTRAATTPTTPPAPPATPPTPTATATS